MKPLEGCKVIDLTSNMTGPYATMLLADQGADVIKIESPDGGDMMRRVGTKHGVSPYFANLNRGKRSVTVDLASESGRDVVLRLASTADVFIQNFRNGVIERLGLAASDVRPLNDRLVYVSVNGYGRSGPLADKPAYDHVVQALSGIASVQGAGGGPSLVRQGVVDKATGLFVSQAITAALLQRARTGTGTEIEVSMLDVALHFLWPDGMMDHTCLDGRPVKSIVNTFRLTETADGHIALITVSDKQFENLLKAAGCERFLEDDDLKTVADRQRNGGRVMKAVAEVFRGLPTEEVLNRLRSNDVPCAEAVSADRVHEDPQVLASGALSVFDHPELGQIRQPVSPARFDGARPVAPSPSPSLGQHTDEVLGAVKGDPWTAASV